MVADSKKCQTFINALGKGAVEIRAAIVEMRRVEADYMASDPPCDTTGTALQGNKADLQASLDVLEAEIMKQCWQDQIDAYQPSHRGAALGGEPTTSIKPRER